VILPGLVDPESGVIRYMPHIQVENWGLVEALEKRFKVTCFVGHDIRSLALAEHYFGASQDCEDSILVRVHRGTGAGIISNGRIFIGRNGNVGEIGHIQVDPLGERCHCGNFGCLETVAANAAIEQRVRHLLEQGYQSKLTRMTARSKLSAKPPIKATRWPARSSNMWAATWVKPSLSPLTCLIRKKW
jgi:N-acetylglucosamine repressor